MESPWSYLPFRAAIGDRDAIHVHYVTRTTGDMLVSTENSTSLPWRSLQLDHEGGYNRIIMNGPINGRATDKITTVGKNDPTCINKYLENQGMGLHIRTLGSKYENASELYYCYGVGGITNVDRPPCSSYDECYLQNSYLTMLKGSGGGRFEQFYQRDLATVIYGEDLSYTKGNKSIKTKGNLFLTSSNSTVTVKNSIDCTSATLPIPSFFDVSGIGMLNSDNSTHNYASGYNNVFSGLGTFIGSHGPVMIRSSMGATFITGNVFVSGLVFAMNFIKYPIPPVPTPQVFEGPSPSVAVQPGYDLFPDSHKAITENIWDVEKQSTGSNNHNMIESSITKQLR
jgi:hypothetical protein